MTKINLQMVDSLMGVFGYTRVLPDNPKYDIGDQVYYEHTYREVVDVKAKGDHYEYELRPYPSKMVPEEEI